MKVSLLIPVCNQRDELRLTLESARPALAGLDTEIVVLDDHSTDGCCHNLPSDVLVLHPRKRGGVSASRNKLAKAATGDVLLWCDPHCRFDPGSLRAMCEQAAGCDGWVQAWNHPNEKARVRTGRLALRGNPPQDLYVQRAYQGDPLPKYLAFYGTVYAVRRDVYDRHDGWPLLPGVWGASEQALSLMCWFSRTPVYLADSVVNIHKDHGWHKEYGIAPDRFPFKVRKWDSAANRHYVYAAFFPRSYPLFWEPMLDCTFPRDPAAYKKPLASGRFKRFCRIVEKLRVRTEEQFYRTVLQMEPPPGMAVAQPAAPKDEDEYRREQEARSKDREYGGVHPRAKRAMKWAATFIPADDRGSVLDLGTRDGWALDVYGKLGWKDRQGVEYSRPATRYAQSMGRTVIEGDMRQLPYADAAFGLVSSIHSLEHVPQPERAVSEMFRVCKDGGYIFIVVPCEAVTKDPAHYTCWPDNSALLASLTAWQGGRFDVVAAETKPLDTGKTETMVLLKKKNKGE